MCKASGSTHASAAAQVVITPCEKYMPLSNEAVAAEMHRQVQKLFPSARNLTNTWHSVVKIQQSLYRCASPPRHPALPRCCAQCVCMLGQHGQGCNGHGCATLLWRSEQNCFRAASEQNCCREAPGLDRFRPDQQTPVVNMYLAGSYTAQDYIDSMEGATLSGRQAAYKILANAPRIAMRQPSEAAEMTPF
jgi:uncharacterized protein with NAD-binding domain and iron-sulfur cluster